MFIDTLRPESTFGRICEAAFPMGLPTRPDVRLGARIYKHATPDGVGNKHATPVGVGNKHATPVGVGNVVGSLLFY